MSLPVVSDRLHSYLADVNRYPVLSAKDEYTIAERYYRTRNIDDAHRLVTSNLRYVIRIALEFRNYGVRLADLVQEGNIGLMVAVKKFNPYKGYRLITYATWWIRASIQDFILKSTGLVRRGSKALKKKLFYKSSTVAADAQPQSDVAAADLSLNSSVSGDPNDTATHLDLLRDGRPGQEDLVAEAQERAIAKKEVSTAIERLSDKERFVVEKRVMAEEPESLQEIGARLGLTRERVRQIEAQALKKLKQALA